MGPEIDVIVIGENETLAYRQRDGLNIDRSLSHNILMA